MSTALNSKQEANERHQARKLERYILQYKANQALSKDVKQQMGIVEDQDPTLFEELSLKRKWSHVSKDPSKGLKDEGMNQNSYWSMLNHLPAKGVERIVTERILNYDKDTCDLILQKILMQKQQADLKKEFM